jgi:CheY-like chemotaxis protein
MQNDTITIRKVLIIDDDETARALFCEKLQNFRTQVDLLESAVAAWNYIETINNVDIIVCDHNLHEVDGISFYLKLKSAYYSGKVAKPYHKSFILTSNDITLSQRARQNGVHFLVKPCSESEWVEFYHKIDEIIASCQSDMVIGSLYEKTDMLESKVDVVVESISLIGGRIDDLIKSVDSVSSMHKKCRNFQENTHEESAGKNNSIYDKMENFLGEISNKKLIKLVATCLVISFLCGVVTVVAFDAMGRPDIPIVSKFLPKKEK